MDGGDEKVKATNQTDIPRSLPYSRRTEAERFSEPWTLFRNQMQNEEELERLLCIIYTKGGQVNAGKPPCAHAVARNGCFMSLYAYPIRVFSKFSKPDLASGCALFNEPRFL